MECLVSWSKVLKLTWDPIKYSAKTIKNLNNKLADNITESDKSDTPAIISAKINSAINRGNWERWNLRLNKLLETTHHYISNQPIKDVTFEYLFYDRWLRKISIKWFCTKPCIWYLTVNHQYDLRRFT